MWSPYVQWLYFPEVETKEIGQKKFEMSVVIWENMLIALRECKKTGKKQEEPISSGCNIVAVKRILRITMKQYLTVSLDKETDTMNVINIRGDIDHWHLNIL